MTSLFRCFILGLLVLAVFGEPAGAQRPPADEDQPFTKVYRVADLVMPAPNYAFRGIYLPGFQGSNPYGSDAGRGGATGMNMPGMGGMGGGMGGMGGAGGGGFGGGGGGFFSVPSEGSGADKGSAAKPQSIAVPDGRDVLRQQAPQDPQVPRGPGGAGGFGGLGMLPVQTPDAGGSLRFTLSDLIQAIHTTVDPGSWDSAGGSGSIFPLGGMLLINQTRSVHDQIQELLTALRTEGAALRSVTIEAHWIFIDDEGLKELSTNGSGAVGAVVSRDALAKLVEHKQAYRAQVTCFDGQSVHVLSGNVKSMVSSLIPVVGQLDRPDEEQIVAVPQTSNRARVIPAVDRGSPGDARVQAVQFQSTQRSVGYQPVLTMVNLGALLQVTPMLSDNSIVLDLQSIVVSGAAAEKPIEFKDLVSLDRVDVVTQQLMTTLRTGLGRPTLAGGMTLQPGSADGGTNQLYLVVEATLLEDAKQAGTKKEAEKKAPAEQPRN